MQTYNKVFLPEYALTEVFTRFHTMFTETKSKVFLVFCLFYFYFYLVYFWIKQTRDTY